MPTFDESLPAIQAALAERYGPASPEATRDDPFRNLVAVLLGLSVEERKVAPALEALDRAGLLDPSSLAEAEAGELVETLKGAGVPAVQRGLAPLRRVIGWLVERHEGSVELLLDPALATEQLREELSALNGVGPATADTILLRGLHRGAYPLDRASYRILIRHGWIDPSTDYGEARDLLERPLVDDPDALVQLSQGLSKVGREFCRVSVAHCERCPLRSVLPEGGPVQPDP